jgi:hypothetical protein
MIRPVFGWRVVSAGGADFYQAAPAVFHSCFIWAPQEAGRLIPHAPSYQKNPLMRHWFDGTRYRPGKYCAAQYLHRRRRREKIPLANFLICITLSKGRNSSGFDL